MVSKKAKKKVSKTKADLEIIAGRENLKIDQEKQYQKELKKMRRPQVEKLTALKETKKKPGGVKGTKARKPMTTGKKK